MRGMFWPLKSMRLCKYRSGHSRFLQIVEMHAESYLVHISRALITKIARMCHSRVRQTTERAKPSKKLSCDAVDPVLATLYLSL